jgi:formate hydrogenlyase subunit 6/NADH:ubiquinone oxidoreductase subunit I
MNDVRLVLRDEVDALRAALARTHALYEVQPTAEGAEWRRVEKVVPFDWDVPLPLTGAKRFFFPPREMLLRWQGDDVQPSPPATEPFVLFGLRACDLTAIVYQDRFFADDPWYAARRAQALLVGVNCLAACPGGFCADVDAGPFARAGFDLALTSVGEEFAVVEVGSARGQAALTAAGVATMLSDPDVIDARRRAEDGAHDTFRTRPFVARALARVRAGTVSVPEWDALAPACLACTGCTSVCPTCSCFTVVDAPSNGGGERARVWDSCLLEGFQREASGNHPAPHPGDRVRRFWYHKLSGDFAPAFDRPGCVGCGRCDVTCAGSIGALRVLAALGAG